MPFCCKNHQLNLAEFGLAYPDILSLMDAGLIYNSEIESGNFQIRVAHWQYGNSPVTKAQQSVLNYYKFTPTGAELVNWYSVTLIKIMWRS